MDIKNKFEVFLAGVILMAVGLGMTGLLLGGMALIFTGLNTNGINWSSIFLGFGILALLGGISGVLIFIFEDKTSCARCEKEISFKNPEDSYRVIQGDNSQDFCKQCYPFIDIRK